MKLHNEKREKDQGWDERRKNTFCKNIPKDTDTQLLGNIATSLITQNPKEDPWE